jgi:hypothetical protein
VVFVEGDSRGTQEFVSLAKQSRGVGQNLCWQELEIELAIFFEEIKNLASRRWERKALQYDNRHNIRCPAYNIIIILATRIITFAPRKVL